MNRATFDAEVQYRRLFESAKDGILILDAKIGKVIDANPFILDLLGMDLQECVGKELWQLGLFKNIEESKAAFRQLQASSYIRHEDLPLKTKDGRSIDVEFISNAYRAGDREVIQCNIRDISDRVRTEKKLETSELQYRRLFESAKDGILILEAHSGKVIDANPFILNLLGLSHEDCVGKELWQLGLFKDIEESKSAFKELQAVAYIRYEDLPLRTRDGRTVEVEFISNAYLVGDNKVIQCNIRDITERVLNAQRLKEIEHRSRIIIESARDAFISIDSEDKIIDWNRSASEMFGFSEAEVVGENLFDTVISPRLKKRYFSAMKECFASGAKKTVGEGNIEIRAVKKDGNEFPVELSIGSMDYKGARTFNIFIRDISERNLAMAQRLQDSETIKKGLLGIIDAFSKTVEVRDPYTAGHQQQVSRLSAAIGEEMHLDSNMLEGIRLGALIHDVGKLILPAEILSKPGRINALEYELIKGHSQSGFDLLKDIEFPWPIARMAQQHHERIDGSGYPNGLKGDEICQEAKIIGVADVVEAMSSHRPYRPARGIDAALDEIRKQRGILYEPAVVDACIKIFDEKRFAF